VKLKRDWHTVDFVNTENRGSPVADRYAREGHAAQNGGYIVVNSTGGTAPDFILPPGHHPEARSQFTEIGCDVVCADAVDKADALLLGPDAARHRPRDTEAVPVEIGNAADFSCVPISRRGGQKAGRWERPRTMSFGKASRVPGIASFFVALSPR